jgi:hypothetical protein
MTRAPLLLVALVVAPVAGAMQAPPDEGISPNAPSLASDFRVLGKGSTWPQCATKRMKSRLVTMLEAFNSGQGTSFALYFSRRGNMQTYMTGGFAIFKGRDAIGRHVIQRWLRGDGWTAFELNVPSDPHENVFSLKLRLSAHGIGTRELGAKIVVDCGSGLVDQWVGPAFAP